jgi:hypothetical protein
MLVLEHVEQRGLAGVVEADEEDLGLLHAAAGRRQTNRRTNPPETSPPTRETSTYGTFSIVSLAKVCPIERRPDMTCIPGSLSIEKRERRRGSMKQRGLFVLEK